MTTQTWLERRNKRLAKEAAEKDRLAEAFEQAAAEADTEALGPVFRAHGHGHVDLPALAAAQRKREQELIARDNEDYRRELIRKAAELDVGRGKTVSIVDAVVEPTEEWLAKGPVESFTPRLERGTTATVVAYRRKSASVLQRLHSKGGISDDQLAACIWYRHQYEVSGMSGRVKTTNFSLSSGGGSGGMGQAPLALTEVEAIARDCLRTARQAIAPSLLRMFDSIVLHDLPLKRAARFVRCRNGAVGERFKSACDDLLAYCQATQEAFSRDEHHGG